MRSLTMLSTLSLLALSPSSCTPEQIDSFCQVYNKVIVQKGDGKIAASDGVKRRLLANELFYREQCKPGGTT
jgi:hypothetical protein